MSKQGKETIITAYIILMTVALAGGFLAYHVSAPTSAVVAGIINNPVMHLNSFDAVFDPDGTTSIKLAASAKENIKLGLTGKFLLNIESGNEKMIYEGFVFFDGVFGEINGLVLLDDGDSISIDDVKGTVVVTNAIDNTASMLVKLDFKRPLLKNFFVAPRNIMISFVFESYDKRFVSKLLPVRHSDKPIPFPYYTSNFGIVEVNA